MPWLRRNARRLGTLALFAMALQIVGTFGHFHRMDEFAQISIASVKAVAEKAAVAADAGALPSGDGDALCPLCLVGNLVAAAVIASPPVPVLPITYLLLGPPQVVAEAAGIDAQTSFWSRGPPIA